MPGEWRPCSFGEGSFTPQQEQHPRGLTDSLTDCKTSNVWSAAPTSGGGGGGAATAAGGGAENSVGRRLHVATAKGVRRRTQTPFHIGTLAPEVEERTRIDG